ncbi:Membrane-fusion protein [uncultured Candidatus Thioglobus sp.]|nr:Membrane-fusion protein [uncultured Candidatus Thioglobus sp.]SMM99484.1 Membrane-fusion protein [uncultured Candidatus Thioglobus sp.]
MINFRKNALESMTSSEELDKAITIINPVTWLALGVIVIFIVIFVFWSIFANITTYAHAPGIFLPTNGAIVNIDAQKNGTLAKIYVGIGDVIEKNGLIAELSATSIKRELKYANEELEAEQAIYKKISDNTLARKKKRQAIQKEQQQRNNNYIDFIKQEVVSNKKILNNKLELFENHNITQSAISTAKNAYLQSKQQLNSLLSSREDRNYQEVQLNNQNEIKLDKIKQRLLSFKNKVNALKKSLSTLKIKTPIAGRVVEVESVIGANVSQNKTIVRIVSSQSQHYARAEKNIEFIAYVDILNGKKIKQGTEVNVSVNSFNKNSYGFIKGVVTKVSDFPISSAGIFSRLSNKFLVNSFTNNGPTYEVSVRLLQNQNSKNRLQWSTEKGMEIKNVDIGNLGSGEFILSKQRPISKAIPLLKDFFN